jgi:hypothetical protein
MTFGTVNGWITVSGGTFSVNVYYNFEITSIGISDLLVLVTDEFTYLAPGT